MSQAADVGPGAADDLQAADPRGRRVGFEPKLVDLDLSGRDRDRLAAPCLLVEGFASLLQSRKSGRHLRDPAGEGGQRCLNRGPLRQGPSGLRDHALAVVGVGGRPELQGGNVSLGPFVDEVGDPGRASEQDGKDTIGCGVECSAVAGRLDPGGAADSADHSE